MSDESLSSHLPPRFKKSPPPEEGNKDAVDGGGGKTVLSSQYERPKLEPAKGPRGPPPDQVKFVFDSKMDRDSVK